MRFLYWIRKTFTGDRQCRGCCIGTETENMMRRTVIWITSYPEQGNIQGINPERAAALPGVGLIMLGALIWFWMCGGL